MAHLRKAPWAKRLLSAQEFQQAFVANVRGLPCWRVGKVLGSMLYFDFGSKVSVPRVRGGFAEAGEATISVNDCRWTLHVAGRIAAESDSVSDVQGNDLHLYFDGSKLDGVKFPSAADHVELIFSNGTRLFIDTTNQYGTADPIIDFVAPSGEIYQMSAQGLIYLAAVISTMRFVQ